MRDLEVRLAASLRRAPYVWATLIIVTTLVLAPSLNELKSKHPREWIGWVAAGFITYCLFAIFVLWPRFFVGPLKGSEDKLLLIRWVFAITPFMIGFSAVVIGSHEWPVGLGWFVTVWLLWVAATATRRTRPAASPR